MDITGTESELEQDNSGPSRQEAQLLDQVLTALAALQESFDAKIRYDEAKERQIAALHAELETHRQGLYQQIRRPLLADLIGIYDEIANQIAASQSAEAGGMGFLLELVEEVLRRNEVTKFACEGDRIERSRQQVIDVEPTGQAELNKRVARRLRPGFEMDGKPLRLEWVVAYTYTPDTENTP
jgi:molecular chaperone GrpE